MQWKGIVSVVLVIAAVAVGFQASNITTFFSTPKANDSQAVQLVKAYAAYQFNVPGDKAEVVKVSKKHQWDTICLGMEIPDYDCTKQNISGYEVSVKVNGNEIKYRTSEDGKIIRNVKE